MNDGPSIRASYLPIEHLEAELIAAPLSSLVAFQNSMTSLDPALRQRGTQALWRDVESTLLGRFPGTSIDELIARRDRAWFPRERGTSTQLIDTMRLAAESIIDTRGRVGRPRAQKIAERDKIEPLFPADRQRRLWRWLTFALPPDLLLAVADAGTDRPALLSPNVGHALAERGYAEPHLHIGAAVSFDVLWPAVQYELAQSSATQDMFGSPGAEFDDGRLLGPWLLRSAICRPILAAFLMSPNRSRGFGRFLQNARPRLVQRFGVLATHRIDAVLTELRSGKFGHRSPSFELLRDDFATMSALSPQHPSVLKLRELRDLDPVSEWFPSHADQSPEFRFTRSGFEYLRRDGADKLFSQLFWQVVRLRVGFYRHVVQRPMTPGLQWFVRTYSRLWPGRRNIAIEALLEGAIENAGPGLRSLEFRTQPTAHLTDMSDFVQRVDRAAKKLCGRTITDRTRPSRQGRGAKSGAGVPPLEVGIVFHFSRSRGDAARRGLPAAWGSYSHADSEHDANVSGYRYSGHYIANRSYAAALANLVTTFPRTLEIVRGVDLCSDELGVPLWAVRGLIDHVMHAADRAARRLPPNSLPAERPLRVTVHAGEDFVHLLGGIRRVGEVIEFIPLGEGDRIGHAVALGVEPETWAGLVQTVPVTLEERLMDLTWVWRLAMRPSSLPELKVWIPWIREQLDSLADRIFGHDHPKSPAALDKFQRALHNTKYLRRAGFPSGPRPQAEPSKTLQYVIRWLTDRGLFKRAQELDDIDVTAEAPLILNVQRQVRLDIGRLGIAIEVNPSSNLLIGHLGSLEEHPLWRLRPPNGGDSNTPPVRICIGSDDPITFATNLANEYQLVFDAMTESGMSADECDAWIDNVRRTSLDSRFTLPRSDHDLMLPFTLDSSPLLF